MSGDDDEAPVPLGRVEVGGEAVATLMSDGAWVADDPAVKGDLDLLCDPRRAVGYEAVRPYGEGALQRAAKRLGGVPVLLDD